MNGRVGVPVRTLWLVALALLPGIAAAQDAAGIAFIWDDTVAVQPLGGGEPQSIGVVAGGTRATLPAGGPDVYRLANSPLDGPPADGYGFHHGVWAPGRARFAYLEIAPDASGYRVMVWEEGAAAAWLADVASPVRGFLDPLGWAPDGGLLLLERTALYNIDSAARVWRYDPAVGFPQKVLDRRVPPLSGNSALLPGGNAAFIGFDTLTGGGYLVDLATFELVRFPVGFTLPFPPKSAFERYPVEVIGVHTPDALAAWLADEPPTFPAARGGWLHWPLPDTTRSITCYPDSARTAATFAATCPGLTTPRDYEGHQGTDVGGRAGGLRTGTPVYAAAPGVIVQTVDTCQPDDIPCNGAYGNTVLMEHTRVVAGDTQTWFTGYAHLRAPLLPPGTAVTDVNTVIGLSGETGIGGPHLHIEVRYPHGGGARWIDPWETDGNGADLWLGDGEAPPSAEGDTPLTIACRTAPGNNIRTGPGTAYDAVAQTQADANYAIVTTATVDSGSARGDWYEVAVAGGPPLGWIWAGLMADCRPLLGR